MNVLSYFDGISCGRLALEELNIQIDSYFSCEIDKNAIKVSNDNFPDIIRLGDLTKIDLDKLPKIDLFIGGTSCQDFAIAGLRRGMIDETNQEITTLEKYLELKNQGVTFKGESYLFWEYLLTLKYLQNKNPNLKFLLENVKMSPKWRDVITKAIGVEPVLIDSKIHSSTMRKRYYWTNIPQDEVIEKESSLKDIVEYGFTDRDKGLCVVENCSRPTVSPDKIARKYFLHGFYTVIFKDKETFLKLKENYNLAKEGDVRYLNQSELEKSLCLPIGYTKSVSRNVAAGLIGNGWNIETIKHLFKNLIYENNR